MYYRHFALDGPPFRFTSSPTSVYLGAAHRECLAALEWGLLYDQCGFMLLLGETGTGKTTLVNTVLARRLPNLHLACVPNPRLSFQEILRVVLPQLGVVTDERGKLELIQALERVVANRPEGSRTAIIIDEAQDLTDETFEDLRLLANTVGARDRELQIVLMGHPELLDRLSAHHLRQLRERISTKVSLPALSTTESIAYIDYRLQAQNGSARIFEPNALKYLINAAAGIPRRLNVLCHNALLLAYSKNKSTVTLEVAREVVGDYQGIFPLSNVEPRPAPAHRRTGDRENLRLLQSPPLVQSLRLVRIRRFDRVGLWHLLPRRARHSPSWASAVSLLQGQATCRASLIVWHIGSRPRPSLPRLHRSRRKTSRLSRRHLAIPRPSLTHLPLRCQPSRPRLRQRRVTLRSRFALETPFMTWRSNTWVPRTEPENS